MEIKKVISDGAALLCLIGRLDSMTAKTLDAELPGLVGVKNITLDLKDVEYVSSAGLRILLALQQQVDAEKGKLILINVCDEVMEVFEMTCFSEILTIE